MPQFSKRETCETVRDMSAQLATLANDAGLDVLAHLLKMAELEAANELTALAEAKAKEPPPRLIPAAGCRPASKVKKSGHGQVPLAASP